jgi:RNA polymerase primary sigma factor
MTALTPYLASVRRTRLLDADEERLLVVDVKAGDRHALERLVRANLPFVLKVAKEYRGRGVAFEDLVAEGNLGLLEAAPRYEPARGTRFVTYAMWWIRKRMLCALDLQARTVRVPGQFWSCRSKAPGKRPQPLIEVRLGPDGTPIVERLRDFSALDAERDLVHREALHRVRSAVASLNDQERRVLDHRFGLQGEAPLTLRETGEQLRLSRERVRQLEQRAIARLKRALHHGYPRAHVLRAAPPSRPPSSEVAV